MTVAAQTPISSYTGNGVTTAFSFGYYVAASGDLVVMVDGVVKALTTDYTLTGIGSGSGGTCTFLTAPASGAAVVLYRDTDLLRDTDYQDNGDLLAAILNGDFDRIWLALQETITGAKLSPRAVRAPVGETLNELPAAATRAGKILSFNAATGQPEAVAPTSGTATDLAIQLASTAAGDGAEMVGFLANGTGPVPSTVDEKLNAQPLDAVADFGCDNTGATNTTAALKLFYEAAIASGSGHIPSGQYKVTRSTLAFDNGHVNTSFPYITTGSDVEFIVDSATPGTAGPILAFTNGTAVSGAGKFWLGGYHGSIQFTGLANTSLTYTNDAEHGLSLRGVQEIQFGLIYGYKLGGSSVFVEEALYSGNNPDPYHVALCTFEGIKAEYCKFALENNNWVGCTHNDYGTIRAIATRAGIIYGVGTDCVAGPGSASACAGWSIDDGGFTATTGGTPSRWTTRGGWELDGVQYGFRLNRIDTFHAPQVRFVYRRNHTTENPTTYWPASTIDFCSGTSPTVRDVKVGVLHRIESSSGAVLGDLGDFLAFNSSSSLNGVVIDNVVLADNSGLGVTSANLVTSEPGSSGRALVLYEGSPIRDTNYKVGALVRAAAGTAVGTAGYGSLTAKIAFATELYDKGGFYDSANSWFTVPYSGLYRVSGRITLVPNAASTTLFLGFGVAVSGVFSQTILDKRFAFGAGIASTTFDVDAVLSLTAGQQVFLMAVQSGGSSNLASPISDTANQTWSIEAL